MTLFHYGNVRMHNISKADELKVSWVDNTCKCFFEIKKDQKCHQKK